MGEIAIFLTDISKMINMVICMVCGIALWRQRHGVPDRSRTIMAILLLSMTGYYVYLNLFSAFNADFNPYRELIPPNLTFIGLLNITLLSLYPIEVMRPYWLNWQRVAVMFMPFLLLLLPGVLSVDVFYRPLHAMDELLGHLGEVNVWLRLVVLASMFLFLGVLLKLPFNRRQSSADSRWVHRYVLACTITSTLYIGKMFNVSPYIHLAHSLWAGFFFLYYTWYELRERLAPSVGVLAEDTPETGEGISDDLLWKRITDYIDVEQKWRDPDLGLEMLCQEVMSNKTYVSLAFRQHASTTFNEYVNRCRINYVAERLEAGLSTDLLKDIFFEAGFRTHSTAYRQFVRYKGVSPTQYIASLH